MVKNLKFKEVKLEKRETCNSSLTFMTEKNKEKIEKMPAASDDCADITSRYDRYEKDNKKSEFPPIEYEKPPHH